MDSLKFDAVEGVMKTTVLVFPTPLESGVQSFLPVDPLGRVLEPVFASVQYFRFCRKVFQFLQLLELGLVANVSVVCRQTHQILDLQALRVTRVILRMT